MTLNMTYFDAALKEMYPEDVMKNLTYKDHPFFALVPKKEDWVGDAIIVPVTRSNPQGRSATFSHALANKGYSGSDKFVVTHARDYSLVSIDNLTIEVSQSSEGAVVDALKYEIDNGIASLSHSLGSAMFGNKGGAIGVVGSVTTTSLTLATPADVVHFEVGMQIVASDTDGTSGSVRSGYATISDINRDTGVLTASANWTTGISALVAGDYLFAEGDFGAKLTGLAGWIPSTAPSSTAFFSVDRTTDVTRLAGLRISSTDVAGLPIEEKLLHGATRLAREGAAPDVCFVSYETFRDIEISLQSKVMYVDAMAGVDVFFRGIALAGPRGTIKVIADQNCPANKAYMLTMNSWKLASTGAAPHILDRGGKLITEASADAYEVRIGFYGNLYCNAPGRNAVIDLS